MAASELRRRVVSFVIFAGVIITVLIILPGDDWVRAYLYGRFDLIINPDGTITTSGGGAPPMIAETSLSLVLNLLHILKIILWMTLVVSIVRFFAYVLIKTVYRSAAPGEVASLVKTVISVIIYIVSFFIIFQSQYPNVQLAPLFTGSTIIGIVVGLALQDTLGNLFAGIALQADQPFQVGDVIRLPVSNMEGVVEAVSWRGVRIRNFQNKLVIVSNAVLGRELIEVSPRDNLNARSVFFNTLYTNSPAKTLQSVREAARHVENVSPKMRPVVRIRNLAPDGIDWEVKYWLEDYTKYNDTDALIRQRIWYVFKREKIDFAYPTRTIYREEKPEEATHDEVVNTIADRLSGVAIFAPLSEEELERLANVSTTRIYAPGEAVVRTGQEGNSMYVVLRGSVKVQIPEKGYKRTINTLKVNDFFGEMSLLTGEPRSADVIAVEESEVLRIDKSGIKPIFEGNPQLVETISEMIEERRLLLQKSLTEEEEKQKDPSRRTMLGSIRKFFGLR